MKYELPGKVNRITVRKVDAGYRCVMERKGDSALRFIWASTITKLAIEYPNFEIIEEKEEK